MLSNFFAYQRIGEFPDKAAFLLYCLLQEGNSTLLTRKLVLFQNETVRFAHIQVLYHKRA